MSAIAEAKAVLSQDFKDGFHEMEAGFPIENDLNDHTRNLIAAYAQEHGECWLGKVNLYAEDRGKPCQWKWDGGLVYNFGASYVIPHQDAELERLVLERDAAPYTGTKDDYARIACIFDRIAAVGGYSLTWN